MLSLFHSTLTDDSEDVLSGGKVYFLHLEGPEVGAAKDEQLGHDGLGKRSLYAQGFFADLQVDHFGEVLVDKHLPASTHWRGEKSLSVHSKDTQQDRTGKEIENRAIPSKNTKEQAPE